jgi:hypothetical protein
MAKTYLTPEEIEAKVQDFLRQAHPENTLPIPIEEIVDLKMGIHIVPMVRKIMKPLPILF